MWLALNERNTLSFFFSFFFLPPPHMQKDWCEHCTKPATHIKRGLGSSEDGVGEFRERFRCRWAVCEFAEQSLKWLWNFILTYQNMTPPCVCNFISDGVAASTSGNIWTNETTSGKLNSALKSRVLNEGITTFNINPLSEARGNVMCVFRQMVSQL